MEKVMPIEAVMWFVLASYAWALTAVRMMLVYALRLRMVFG